ncbi:hypothetical protein ACH0BF_16655 [Pseudobacillus sp. 179-B 2D1 NHS]|uniref:hypothetical protein n=1 Tax=Pseudobacillus sp. 179-B 2D1 NHS TaxID=3374292 RepID=UPI00387985FF
MTWHSYSSLEDTLLSSEEYYATMGFLENLHYLKSLYDLGIDMDQVADELIDGISPCPCGQCYSNFDIAISIFKCGMKFILSLSSDTEWTHAIELISSFDFDEEKFSTDYPHIQFSEDTIEELKDGDEMILIISNFFQIAQNKQGVQEALLKNVRGSSFKLMFCNDDLLISFDYLDSSSLVEISNSIQKILAKDSIETSEVTA